MILISEYTSNLGDAYWKRLLLIALGLLLQLGAILIFAVILVVIVISSSDNSTESVYLDRAFRILIAASIAVGSAIAGWRFLRGRRQMLLFLRRFGFDDATRIVTSAVEKNLGKTWRVVTLDDKRVSPVGVSRRLPISLAVTSAILFIIFVVGSIGLYKSGLRLDFDPGPALAQTDARNPAAVISKAVAVYLVIMIIISFFLFPMLLLGALAAFLLSVPFAAWRAERSKKINVSKEVEIDQIVTKLAKTTKGLFVPRFVVLNVETLIWQPTVCKLARLASAIVVDVSIPSENLLWEIERLRSIGYKSCIYVADRDRIEDINSNTVGDQQIVARWRKLLSGHTVITYSLAPGDQNKFERSLRNRLRDC